MDIKLTNLGIEISFGVGEPAEPLIPSSDADQLHPRRHYVYAHTDDTGEYFYIGTGKERRAWSTDRHTLWHRYVDKHLSGCYHVKILQDDLQAEQAEEAEAEWIAQHSSTLVNWINMGRDTDFDALDRFHKLRNANRELIVQAKQIEKSDLEHAAQEHKKAISRIREYAFIEYERGLVGKLLAEESEELGWNGEVEALERLTLCLIELGEIQEAARMTDEYFTTYRRDLLSGAAKRIKQRLAKAGAGDQPGAP